MRRLAVFHLIIQPGNKFPDHVNISPILVWKSKRQFQKHVMDLFEVVKCSTPVYKGRYMYNFKGIKYKCESSDIPVELFSGLSTFVEMCYRHKHQSHPTNREALHLPTAYLMRK